MPYRTHSSLNAISRIYKQCNDAEFLQNELMMLQLQHQTFCAKSITKVHINYCFYAGYNTSLIVST